MCVIKKPKVDYKAPQIAAPDGVEATRSATIEGALRARRRGAAADVLTSPTGIPAAATLGGK